MDWPKHSEEKLYLSSDLLECLTFALPPFLFQGESEYGDLF